MQQATTFLLLDTKPRNPNHYICLAIRDGLEAAGAKVCYVGYDDAVSTATSVHCHVFLAFDGEEMHVDVCRRLVELCDLSVLWLSDDPYEAPSNLEASRMFDRVYSNDKDSVPRYGAKGRHLPFAGSPKYHFHDVLAEESGQLRYDVFFCGAAWPNRVSILDPILRELNGKRFKLGLAPVQDAPLPLPLPESSYKWRTPVSELARLANRSRITLALHRDFTTNSAGMPLASTPPPRMFEAALAGTLQFYDSVLNETSDYFEPGKEIVSYDSPRDCIEKLRYYLENPEQRYLIARAGQVRALRAHTYECRARVMITDIDSVRARERPRLEVGPERPRLLFVTHNIRPAGHFGGVEVYQEGIAKKLSERYDIFFYYRDRSKGPNTYILTDADYDHLEEIRFDNECFSGTLSVPVKESVFATLLESYRIRLIHFQHLVNHPASLVMIAKLLDIPVVLTLQDFWVMCDSHNLVDYRKQYCDIPNRPDSACDICITARLNRPAGTQTIRKNFFRRVLDSADVVVGNTEGFHRILARFYPEIVSSDKVMAIPLPLPDSKSGIRIREHTRSRHEGRRALRIAVLGNFTFEKGAEAILFAINQLRSAPVQFVIFGRVDQPYDKVLPSMNFPNLTIHGQYHHAELPRLLKDVDLALHLSMWPETYCIALSEAWHNGLVPVVADIGALGERVIHGENGWKIAPDDAAGLLDLIRRILAKPELLVQMKQRLAGSAKLFETEPEHVEKLSAVYEKLLSRRIRGKGNSPGKPQTSRLTLFDSGVIFNQSTWSQVFEAYREGTSVVSWKVDSGNRYVSQKERTDGVAGGQPVASLSLMRNQPAPVYDNAHLQQLALRVEILERSVHQNRMQIEALYQSRIWKALCAGGDLLLRLNESVRRLKR